MRYETCMGMTGYAIGDHGVGRMSEGVTAISVLAKIMAAGGTNYDAPYVRLGKNQLDVEVIVELDDAEVTLLERLRPGSSGTMPG